MRVLALLLSVATAQECGPQCESHSCYAIVNDTPERACSGCSARRGDNEFLCFPGARGYAPPTPEEEQEIAISALVAGSISAMVSKSPVR